MGDLTLVIGSTTYRIHITAQVRRAEAIAYAEQVFAALQRHDWQTVCGFVDPDDVLLAKEDFLVHDFQTYWPRITTRGLGTFGQQNVFGMGDMPTYLVPMTVQVNGQQHRDSLEFYWNDSHWWLLAPNMA